MDLDTIIHLKKELLKACLEMQEKRIEHAQKAMNDAQQAANQEERSTAGDKYDTSRAMSQNVRDMNAKQLQEALRDLAVLQQINPTLIFTEVRLGSIVHTSNGNFFIALSGSTYSTDKETYLSISPGSPIGQLMLNKKRGDSYNFRGKNIRIEEVY